MRLLPTSQCLLALCALGSFANPLIAQGFTTVRVANGIATPTSMAWDPTHPNRIFVATNRGVRVVENGTLLSTWYINLQSEISEVEGVGGFTLHPDYATNGKCYIAYIDDLLVTHLDQYQVDAGNPAVVDVSTKQEILPATQQPGNIHNWNSVVFGPDDKLYVGSGDGGNGNSDKAQDLDSLFGKILRLDVDLPAPHVPPDNPFVGVSGARPEIYHVGVRQPWRITFDSLTGDMYIGEVGRGEREEISFIPAGVAGANLGWDCVEGTHCSLFSSCSCGTPEMLAPIHEYGHDDGRCAIIGGYVYRGSAIPELYGAYLFGDFCTGRVWTLRHDGTAVTELVEITDQLGGDFPLNLPISFGEGPDGELYVNDKLGNEILKFVPDIQAVTPYCVTTPNSVGPGATLSSTGTTSLSGNDMVLEVAGLPASEFGLAFYGIAQTQAPFGDGFLCVAGGAPGLARVYPVDVASGSGELSKAFDFTELPFSAGPTRVDPGSTWNIQYWYRDPFGPMGTGFNLSDALSVLFLP